jgi:monoamine oxidase
MQGESDRAAQEPLRKRRVVVLGAGIAGLTSAGVLQLQGCDVTVLEAVRYMAYECS